MCIVICFFDNDATFVSLSEHNYIDLSNRVKQVIIKREY